MAKLQIYKSADGWRWRFIARNGRILADSGEAGFIRVKTLSWVFADDGKE